jgi:hypothetical protein
MKSQAVMGGTQMWAMSTQYSTGLVGATTGMDVRAQHTTAIAAGLAERYSPATANLMVAAVRGVLRACRRLGLICSVSCPRVPCLPSS